MKKSGKIAVRLIAAFTAILMLAGCGSSGGTASGSGTGSNSQSVSVTDMAGRQVELDAPAEKIVALEPADCEILYAIGAGSTLVGRGEYCDYPEEVSSVPSVSTGSEFNAEEIIVLEPQLVIMSTMATSEDAVRTLEDAGIKVVVTDAQDIDGVYQAIELIGAVTGNNDEAESLITDMKTQFDEVETAAGTGTPSIYFEVSPLEYGLWTAGSGTFMDEIATMIGCKNLFSDVTGWAEVSEEQVIERNPDYIVTITMYYGEGLTPEEEIASRTGWEDVTAVKEGRIINIQDNSLSRPGPRLAEGAKTLSDFVWKGIIPDAA